MDYRWMNVGEAGFSGNTAYYISLAIDPSGQPYVAFKDYGTSYRETVMKFDGTSWVNVGIAGFSLGEVSNTNLSINLSGELFVAFKDCTTSPKGKVTVMNYDSILGSVNELRKS
jgi:hypothetical protein